MLNQEQIDKLVRSAKAALAVEELIRDTPSYQVYLLSDGTWLRVDKNIGLIDFKFKGKGRWLHGCEADRMFERRQGESQ